MAALALSESPRPQPPRPVRPHPRPLQHSSRLGRVNCVAPAVLALASHVGRRRSRLGRHFAAAFLTERAETRAASDLQLGKLLTWARNQDFMKLHPCLTVVDSQLTVSVPVPADTPIIGVLQDAFLTADRDLPDGLWAAQLGLSLLEEQRSPSSEIWENYQHSVAPQPASALLWSPQQAQELQYVDIKKELQSRVQAVQKLTSSRFSAAGSPSAFELGQAIATASRAVEVAPGRWALLPLLDLVGPPEATVLAGEEEPEPNCTLQIEPKGGPGGRDIAILLAARDLQQGEKLSRPLAMSADELLLQHGLATTKRSDDVTIHVGLKKKSADVKPWQLSTLRMLGLESGAGWISAKVRRSSSLMKAIDAKLLAAARVLSSKSREEVYGAEWNMLAKDEILAAGLTGLSFVQRLRVFFILQQAIKGALTSYETSLAEDEEILRSLRGRDRAAVAYRLGKKRILNDVLEALEKASVELRQKRAQSKQEAMLPTAMTGKKKSTAGKGFG